MTERIVETLAKINNDHKGMIVQDIIILTNDGSELDKIYLLKTPCPIENGTIFNYEKLLIGK